MKSSVWDIYYEFMTILFGVDHPFIIDIVIFVLFLILVFGLVLWIIKSLLFIGR